MARRLLSRPHSRHRLLPAGDGTSTPTASPATNPQIVPVHTLEAAPNAVTVGTVTVEVRDTEIFVSAPISDDANGNSYATVEIATDPGGPWTERCGSPSENRLPHHPKRCRLRSLTPGIDYWVRIDFVDPDGVSGADPQVLGPVTYGGRQNLAAGRPITADPGWGCCPNPAQLVDGRIQYRFWPYGFAWTGGTTGYGGGPAGWKQATIDLGSCFDLRSGGDVAPRRQLSADRLARRDQRRRRDLDRGVVDHRSPMPRRQPSSSIVHLGLSLVLAGGPVRTGRPARYVRYWFDDRTLFGGLHGWAVELEVFAPPSTADLSIIKTDSPDPVVAGGALTYTVTVDNAGPADAADVVVDRHPAGGSQLRLHLGLPQRPQRRTGLQPGDGSVRRLGDRTRSR